MVRFEGFDGFEDAIERDTKTLNVNVNAAEFWKQLRLLGLLRVLLFLDGRPQPLPQTPQDVVDLYQRQYLHTHTSQRKCTYLSSPVEKTVYNVRL